MACGGLLRQVQVRGFRPPLLFFGRFFALFSRVFWEVGLGKMFCRFSLPVTDWPTGAGRGGGAGALPAVARARVFAASGVSNTSHRCSEDFFRIFSEKHLGGRGAPPSAVSARAEKKAPYCANQRTAHQGQHYRTTRRYFGPTYSATFETRLFYDLSQRAGSGFGVRHSQDGSLEHHEHRGETGGQLPCRRPKAQAATRRGSSRIGSGAGRGGASWAPHKS